MARAALLAAVICLGGCATYVNIPAQHGDLASHNPNDVNVKDVEIAAIRYALDRNRVVEQPVALMLPAGTSDRGFEWIVSKLDAPVHRYGSAPPDALLYRVAQVQVRALRAQVDIVQPGPAGSRQLLSTYLKRDLEGWYVYRDYLWQIPVDEALYIARPAPAASEEEAEAPDEQAIEAQ
jgi:hypothetical protein